MSASRATVAVDLGTLLDDALCGAETAARDDDRSGRRAVLVPSAKLPFCNCVQDD